MIVAKLEGGLGNQMFQYAAGLSLSEHLRTVLKLDVRWFQKRTDYASHNRYALSCLNVTEQFATEEECRPSLRLPVLLAMACDFVSLHIGHRRSPSLEVQQARAFHFYDEFFQLPDNSLLIGWWQSEKFFAAISDLVRLNFTTRYPLSAASEALMREVRRQPSVSIHLRRGDYVKGTEANRQHGVPGPSYYMNALQMLHAEEPNLRVFVFSDDPETARVEFGTALPHVFIPVMSPYHAHEAMCLMSACDYNVVANSSFSWWGAWLNKEVRKVIAPTPWFRSGPNDGRDVVPGSWTCLPACYDEKFTRP